MRHKKPKPPISNHPCINCGACCGTYRVSFLRSELAPNGLWKVPASEVEDHGTDYVSLKGTTKNHHPSCNQLQGRIGKKAWCGMYENRPSPCRNFKASYEDGTKQPRCDEARRVHGLRPLTKNDWSEEVSRENYLPSEAER